MDILIILTAVAFVAAYFLLRRRKAAAASGAQGVRRVEGADLSRVTGIVRGSGRHAETIVTGTGSGVHGGPVNVDIRSESVLHQQFFLQRHDGIDEPVKMWGFDVPLADGQTVTMIRATRGKRARMSALVNHNARRSWPLYTDAAQVAEHLYIVPRPMMMLALSAGAAAFGTYLVVEVVVSNYQRISGWPVAIVLFVLAWLALWLRRRVSARKLNRAITAEAKAVLDELGKPRQAG